MTYPNLTNVSIFSAAGLARAQWAIVNSLGLPYGSTGSIAVAQDRGMSLYVAVKRAGSDAVTPRTVDVTGDNGRFRHRYQFNPAEIGNLNMNFGVLHLDALAAFTGTNVESITDTDWNAVGFETNAAVNTNSACLIFNLDIQDADTESGQPRWYNLFYPVVTVTPQFGAHEEAAGMEWPYQGSPTQSARYPWGKQFTTATNGFTKAVYTGVSSYYPITMHTYVSNGSTLAFTLDYAPASDDTGRSVKVFKTTSTGTTTELTKTTDFTVTIVTKTITLTSAGSSGDTFVVVYEATDLISA